MEWNLFKEKMDSRKYDELEASLKEIDNNLDTKYQLGIVYSYQDNKISIAIDIFKELIEKDFHKEYIYTFLSDYTFDYNERINIIKCGVSLFPKSESLNRLLLEITTDYEDGKKIYSILSAQNCLINYDHLKLAELCYSEKNYKQTVELLEQIKLEEQDNNTNNYIVLLKSICMYYLNADIKLKDIKKYTIGNLKEEFGYLGFYLEIAHYLKIKNYKKVNELIKSLQYNIFSDTFFEIFINDGRCPCYFDFEYFLNDINFIILEHKEIEVKSINKIRTIKIIYELQYDDEERKINKKEIKNYIKILKEEIFENKDECLIEAYFDLLMKNNDQKAAINFIFENYLYSLRYEGSINFDNYEFSLSAIDLIYSKMMNRYSKTELNKKEKNIIILLIKLLYTNKEYNKLCSVAEKYNQKIDFYQKKVLFNIAYSYAELDNDIEAEKMYLQILEYEQDNSSVLNNLGIIYEKRGEIEKALEYLQKAEAINHSDTHIRNIKRCNQTIEENKKNIEEIFEGKENIKKENVFIINKFETFCGYKNEFGDIICSYGELPKFLAVNFEKSKEVLDTFLRKKYIFKLTEHSYQTSKSVYKVNSKVEEEILNIKNNNKLMNEVINKLNKISLNNMEDMDLNAKFLKIESVNNLEISLILKRDYYELFEAYVLKNQKSVTVLAGGIIEAILTYIIKENNQTIGNKLYDYDLTELLNICKNNNYINSVPLNFISGLKRYRNFVHPGVEIRENKRNIKIGDESTNLLWDFVNWLIDYAI